MKRVVACISGLLLGWAALCMSSASAQDDTKAKDDAPKAETPAETAKPAAAAEQSAADAKKEEAKPEAEAGHSHAKDEGHDDHAHHDPHDNTHKNASAKLAAVDEIRFDQAFATFIIFLLLTAILAKFAWGPITDGLDKREQGIAKMIEDAEMAQKQAEAQLRSYEAKLAAAADEARAMVAQARADADATRERELAATKAENEKLLQRNKDEIEAAKNAALQQIAEKSVNTAISLASNIVRREVKPEDHDALVTDALSKFTKLN